MSTFTSSGAYATLAANNAQLYHSSRNAFAIHQNNGFISVKSPRLKIKKLNESQKQQLKAKIKAYASREKRSIWLSTALSLAITAGIFTVSYQLINLLL